jgi:predicted Fe-Mo cluster-binding NifX family protein
MNEKIAVPTRDGHVDNHFGHCDHYSIFTIADKKIISKESLPSPQGCGCKSGIAKDLQEMGVSVMLAGNMGEGAYNKLQAHGIKVVRGCQGDVEAVVNGYLTGFIFDSGEGCAGHSDDHTCAHH